MNVATQSARGIENPKDIYDRYELPNMTSTPQHHNKKGITDGIETNNNNFKSQLIMDFEENSESMSKKDSTSKQMSETKSETTLPKSYNDLGTKNDINENKSAVGSMIPNDSKGGTDGISRSNVVLAESKRQQLSENKQSSDVDESDVCDVDFTSNYVDLAKSIDPTNNPNNVTVVDLVRGDKGLGLGLIDGLVGNIYFSLHFCMSYFAIIGDLENFCCGMHVNPCLIEYNKREYKIDTSDGKCSFMMNFNMKATTSHILTVKRRQSHLMLPYWFIYNHLIVYLVLKLFINNCLLLIKCIYIYL